MVQDFSDHVFVMDRTKTAAIGAVRMSAQNVDFTGFWRNAFDALDQYTIMWVTKYDNLSTFQGAQEEGPLSYQNVIPLPKNR
jgi:hypothetical protein